MTLRRLTNAPVSEQSFRRLEYWIRNNLASISESIQGYESRAQGIEGIFKYILEQKWPEDEDLPLKFEAPPPNGWQAKPYISAATLARRVLAHASNVLNFDKNAYFEIKAAGDKVITCLYWIDRPSMTTPSGARAFDVVHVIFRHWWNEYVDELLRGMQVMANLLGVSIWFHKTATDDDIPRTITDLVRDTKNDLSIVVILGNPNAIKLATGEARKIAEIQGRQLQIISVGNEQSTIRQNNIRIAKLLGEQMNRDFGSPIPSLTPRRVVLVGSDLDLKVGVAGGDAFSVRQEALKQELEDGGVLSISEKVRLTRDEMFGVNVDSLVKDRLVSILKKDNNKKHICAIYAQTSLVGLGALRAVVDRQREADIKVYCEYVSPFLLRWLLNPASPLQAISGSDPFHYGRYALRSAVIWIDPNVRCPAIEPYLLTRKLARPSLANFDASIGYMVEIPEKLQPMHPDVDWELNDLKYAWQPWMQTFMKNAYGPELRRKLILEKIGKS